MKNKKNIMLLLTILLIITSLCACNNKKDENKNIEAELVAQTMTELNVPLKELKNDMTQFILLTYMPSASDTKQDYVKDITKYLSETEYDMLLNDIGEYSDDIETVVKELSIKYGLAENNSDNTDKILCSFYLVKSANGVSVRNKIDLVFTIQGGEITHHAVYMGKTEKRS